MDGGGLTQEFQEGYDVRSWLETAVAGAELEACCQALGQNYKESVEALVSPCCFPSV